MREYMGKPRDERVSGEANRRESIWGSKEIESIWRSQEREYPGKPRDERVSGEAKR